MIESTKVRRQTEEIGGRLSLVPGLLVTSFLVKSVRRRKT